MADEITFIPNEDIKNYYSFFMEKAKTSAVEIQKELMLEDGEIGNLLAQVIVGAMNSSVTVTNTLKRNTLLEEQINLEKEKINLAKEQVTAEKNKAKLILEQMYMQMATRLRQQGVTINEEGKPVLSSEGNSIAEKNIDLLTQNALKVVADTADIKKKTELMEKQVFHNCLIQGMKQSAEYTLAIANGGLIPDNKMHTNFYLQAKALLLHSGVKIKESGSITMELPYDAESEITLGTFDTSVTVTEAS